VRADSTLLGDPEVTPVFQPTLDAFVGSAGVELRVGLGSDRTWSYRLLREDLDHPEIPLAEVAAGARASGGDELRFLDRPPPGRYRYELEAIPVGGPPSVVLRASAGPVSIPARPEVVLSVRPDPWNGNGSLQLKRSPSVDAATLELFAVSGRRLHRLPWPAGSAELSWDGRDGAGRRVASGVYYAGLRDARGRLRNVTTLVVER
jgi:hypothetical protein